MDNISVTEAARLLGVSVEGLKTLESQGLLHKPYTAFEINKIKSRPGLTLADEAAIVNAQIEQEVVVSVSGLMSFRKKAALLTAGILLILLLLTTVLALLFNFYPLQTSDFFGYYFRYNAAAQQANLPNKTGGKVLAAATGPGVAIPQTSVLADITKPLAAASLVAVKAVDNQKYAQIVTNPVEAAGLAAPSDTPGPPGQSGASGTEGSPGLTGLTGPAGPAGTAGSNGSNGSSVADVMTAIGDLIIRNSSNTTAKLAAGTNTQVLTISGGLPTWADPSGGGGSAFSSLTGGTNTTAALVVGSGASLDFLGTGSINASTLNGINFGTISNDATINSTGVLTLKSVGTTGTYGSGSLIPVLTTDAQGRVSGVTNTAISGLTVSNFGSANISQWTNNSGYLTAEADTLASVTTRGATTATALTLSNVANSLTAGTLTTTGGTINGTTIGATTPSSGVFTTLNGLTITNNGSNTLAIATGKTLTASNSLTFTGTDGTSFAFPTSSDDVVGRTVTQTLTNKTIAAGSNTISGLTNTNLSGTAGITNANLANSALTVTAGSGLTGGGSVSLGGSTTVNLNLTTSGTTGAASANSGLEVSGSGLTLLKGCTDNEILKWTDAGGWACAADTSGGSPVLNTIAAAAGSNSINNADNAQIWNWSLTTAAKTAFSFSENSASTNGAGSQYILGLSTLAGSTAAPLKVSAQGNTIIDTTSTGALTFGNTTANTAITLQSGTGAINIGADANAKTITIGNTTGATALNLDAGSGNINLNSQLVLDSQSADPTGVNGGMYYNTTTSKFRCYENSAWANCITPPGSDLQSAATYKTDDSLINVGSSQVTLASVSVTPTTATGDVYVRAKAEILSSNNTDQSLVLSIEDNATCTGSTLETNTISITVATGIVVGDFEIADVEVDAGASSQSYSLCASTATGDSDIRLYEMFATVIDTGADLAELYTTNDTSIEEGDVVSLDPSLQTGIKKSQTAYDPNVLGIISTRPGLVIGGVEKEGVNAMPVALSGRVLVKVSSENGKINAGDYLTTSETPGVAMKSTKAGAIIGTAMSSFDGERTGKILVFVKNGSSMGNILENENNVASASAKPTLSENVILQIIADYFKNALEFLGTVVFRADVSFLGRPTFNQDTAGHVQITAGEQEIVVVFAKEYLQNPVVTASVNLAGAQNSEAVPSFAVYDLSTKGFKIKLTKPANFDLAFSWIALAINEASPTPVESISTPTPEPDLEASPSGPYGNTTLVTLS